MKNLYLVFLFLGQLSWAQKIAVTGQVSDSTENVLAGATVMLLNPADSSLVNFGVTDNAGVFQLKNITPVRYWLKITFVGYKTYSGFIDTAGKGDVVDVGSLHLTEARSRLDEVVVEERIPVVIKKDTIEYNATAFKTIKNGTVEDLLKRLPGVDVDSDGNITAQGEAVKRVTVDGKEFFGGNDPKLRNEKFTRRCDSESPGSRQEIGSGHLYGHR